MLQMNKTVESRPTLESAAGVLIPASIVVALAASLVIGLVVVVTDFVDYKQTELPVAVAGISSRAPDISDMFVREANERTAVVEYCADSETDSF